ncbi:MAG: PorP/SprF family type IX secretion system membrane protein [Crocinitomicaceae bacterium]|nr:PorP/SprF family type IX secretion system membrane protein [Crocinitomicaceae bacterium]
MKAPLFTILILLSYTSNAQQEHLSSMFWNNYSEINPATSGLENKHQGMISHRNQNPSLTGNERTIFANYNARVGRRHGVSGNITSGTIGFNKYQEIQTNYSYQLLLGGSRRLSFGAGPSFTTNTISDPWIPFNSRSNVLNFNTGIAYQGQSILAGAGATQLFAIELSNDSITTSLRPHYYAHFRNIFTLTRSLELYLEGLYRTSNAVQSLEFNARLLFYNKLMLGVGYRSRDTYIAHIGWDIDDHFRIAYAYERGLSKLSTTLGESHEFTLGYVVKYRVRRKYGHYIGTPSF